MNVTYQIYTGDTPGIALSQAEEQKLAQYLATLPYSTKDTPAGAVARLPLSLPSYHAQGSGLAKEVLQLADGRTVLALTYPVPAGGHTVYVPEGWYWWKGAPPELQGIPTPQAGTADGIAQNSWLHLSSPLPGQRSLQAKRFPFVVRS